VVVRDALRRSRQILVCRLLAYCTNYSLCTSTVRTFCQEIFYDFVSSTACGFMQRPPSILIGFEELRSISFGKFLENVQHAIGSRMMNRDLSQGNPGRFGRNLFARHKMEV
jgi:hypothetical protein